MHPPGTAPNHIFIATLGGQPQIVTLALDQLLARGYPISEVIVVHLAPRSERYQAALQRVGAEFVQETYAGHPIRYRPHVIQHPTGLVSELDSPEAIEAARVTLHHLLLRLRQPDTHLHLCISGGRRLLGYLALSLAPILLREQDCIWQLLSADHIREQTRDGVVMHLPNHPEVQLLRLPVMTLSQFLVVSPTQAYTPLDDLTTQARQTIDALQRQQCRQVYDALTPKQREVLKLISAGSHPDEVARTMSVTSGTVRDHLTVIYTLCRNAWDLHPKHYLRFDWLREQFAAYLAAL